MDQKETSPKSSEGRRAATVSKAARIVTLGVAATVAAAVLFPLLTENEDSTKTSDPSTVEGIVLEPLFDDQPRIDLQALKGKPIVINAFASSCPPCIEEMPEFEKVSKELDGKVAFVGLDVVDFAPAGRELVRKTGVTYPTGIDPDASIFVRLGGLRTPQGPVLPHTFFVDEKGRIVERYGGRLPERELRRMISTFF